MPTLTDAEINELPYRPCVGVMLTDGKGHVFAGARIDNPDDAWQAPQGGIDPGEMPEQAALRELWEETGVPADAVRVIAKTSDWVYYDLPRDVVPTLWKGRFRGQKQLWYLIELKGDDSVINIATEHPEFREWQWMTPGMLTTRIVPFKGEVYRKVFDEFESLISK